MQFRSISPEESSQALNVCFEPTLFSNGSAFALWPEDKPHELAERALYLHYHNELEVGWCVEGSGVFFVEDKIIPYKAPCVSVIYRGQAHIAQSSPGESGKWYFLNVDDRALCADWPRQWKTGHSDAPILSADSGPNGQEILALIPLLIQELQSREEGWGQSAEGLLRSVLCKHARMAADCPSLQPPWRWKIAEVAPAVSHIANHYAEACSVEELAGLCGVSPPTLRRKFHQAVGCSPLDYLHRVRVEAAVSMLHLEHKTILEICNQVGYSTPSSFNRQFRRITGESPQEVRRRLFRE